MKFTKRLIKGKFIKRYKRFFADIKLNKKMVTAHCPNTGSMMGLLSINNDVWIYKINYKTGDEVNNQAVFKTLLDENSSRGGLCVLTTNKIGEINEAIRSRCSEYIFGRSSELWMLGENEKPAEHKGENTIRTRGNRQ